ncbi:GNAT family N-acetyltransferase [Pseudomonas sp. REST10]|nr:GNAT family N-acetyltransferase [Pseudomonas sp. REST10]
MGGAVLNRGKAILDRVRGLLSGSGQRESPHLLPGFYSDYVSGPALGCDYYELRAFLGGVLIAESHGHILPEEFRVTKIQVYAIYRGEGYGRKICNRLIEEARSAGCQRFVFEGVDLENLAAVGLYNSLGAKPVKSKTYPSRKDFLLSFYPDD